MDETSNYRRGRHVVTHLHVHLVFVTKYRRAIFTEEMLIDLQEWANAVCEKMGAMLIELNGEKDHIHLLVEYPPKLSVSAMVNALKGVTSRRFREKYVSYTNGWSNALWSPSYFAASCGGAPLDIIKKYIENQA